MGHGCFAIDLDGNVQSFHTSVRDALIERQLLYQDRDRIWHLRWHGFDLRQQHADDLAICDFCSARPVTWNIPCESFPMPDIELSGINAGEHWSRGDWAACEVCGHLIDQRRKEQLLAHCLQSRHLFYQEHPEIARTLRQTQKRLHRTFWKHYHGGAARIPAKPFGH